jgi:hypothetical protein
MKNSIALLLLTLGLLRGQDAAPAYPGGPALNRAPDMSSWRVTCQLATPTGTTVATPAPPPALPFATMTVVKTKSLRQIESMDPAGLKTIRFFDGSMESYTPPGTTTARYFSGDNKKMPGLYINFSQTDFPECAWVKPGEFAGIQVLGDHKCLVFTDKQTSNAPAQVANPNAGAASSTAYIDLETRLPVKNQVNGLTYTYQFLPPPTEMLAIPALMKARIDFEAQRAKALSTHPSAE